MTDPAIPAATIIVVRDRSMGPPELLMVERAAGMAFAGGALVFPGGRIDDADAIDDCGDRAARVAAIRETLEETAVPVGLAPAPDAGASAEMQQALAGGQQFAPLLAERGINLDLDALTPIARWVPKFHAKRRFDTLFFVAEAPDGERIPRIIESECTGAFWATAADVLNRDRAGDAQLIFPTRRMLERLAQHDSFDAIVADARAYPVEPITPWLEEVDGERFITIPEGIGYPVTREKLEGLWRG